MTDMDRGPSRHDTPDAPGDRPRQGGEAPAAPAGDPARNPDDERGERVDPGKRRPQDAGEQTEDEPGREPSEPARQERKAPDEDPPQMPAKAPFVIAGLLLLGLLCWGAYRHWSQRQEAANAQTETEHAVPEVRTTAAKQNDRPVTLTLPGQTQAFDTANIYPRATGYIADRRVDIGTRVKKGDLLVRIAAPDLDQQLVQAQAQLGQVQAAFAQAQAQVTQAEANLALAKVTFARTNKLTQQGYETIQNNDNQQTNLASQEATLATAKAGVQVADANIKSQQATVDRLEALRSFESITAPFDGVVTARNVDLGDLLNADSGTGAPMFTVSRDDVLRVSVYVPQSAAVGIRDGLEASVTVPQMPDRPFKGIVQRDAVALSAASRSLMTEVDVNNGDGALRPGLYVSVSFAIPRPNPVVVIPAEALIFDQKGMQVAIVDQDSKIKLQPIKIARDYGTTVEVSAGLSGGEAIVLSPPASLEAGAKVKAKPQTDDPDSSKPEPNGSDKDKQAKADGQSKD